MTRSIALTCGEPAGIAPEITAAAWLHMRSNPVAPFFLIGDADYLASRSKAAGIAVAIEKIASPASAINAFGYAVPVLHRPLPVHPKAGMIEHATAPAVIAAIDEAVALCTAGAASAMVTNPIQKEALYHAGFSHQGHTDYIAHLASKTGGPFREVMMLVGGGLRTVPITVHVALADVPRLLTAEAIIDQALVIARDLARYFGIAKPRLLVTGLNPHAGENGAMGKEEQTVIAPAVARLRAGGLDVSGPVSADTAFNADIRGTYDAVLCMYHDQALIPVKTLDFHGGVNVTLGLPFIRTSPDHGTALNLAGTGKANAASLVAALELAADMARRRDG
jgi:4-hydroxythreonine-4-phosphate dehydrogenase